MKDPKVILDEVTHNNKFIDDRLNEELPNHLLEEKGSVDTVFELLDKIYINHDLLYKNINVIINFKILVDGRIMNYARVTAKETGYLAKVISFIY